MMIKLKCPQCGQKMAFPDEAAGKKGSCPNCGHKAVIPAPKKPDGAGGQAPAARPGPAAPAKPAGGGREESPESAALADLQSALGGGQKPSARPAPQRPAEAKKPAPPAKPAQPKPPAKPDQPAAARPPAAPKPQQPPTPQKPAQPSGSSQRPAGSAGAKPPQAQTPKPTAPQAPAPKPKPPADDTPAEGAKPVADRAAKSSSPQPRPQHTRRPEAKHPQASDPAAKRPAPQQRQPKEDDPLAALQLLHQDHEKPAEPAPAAADLDLGNLVGPAEPSDKAKAQPPGKKQTGSGAESTRPSKAAAKAGPKAKTARPEPQPVACRSCGAENPPKASRCKQCNDWVTDAAAEAAARREAQSQKRKQLASGILAAIGMGLLVLVESVAGGLSRLSGGVERSAVMRWLARLPLPVWPAVALLVMVVLSAL